ncbi:hypothetical protein RFI_24720 [Reticulomyxa filosa]|uniref:proline--tRNA ligase n=1 Tax=Reticulomyxa filosa TaxID=46433 RepID=X6MGV1_RETFI|nr:hypothetical protein RFI_24720 [Reticulomyxa filosa]|eukprot:ETO12657.1 hypothetical protein RFI_24720 [Reticulomyxa filosa]
MNRTKNPGFKFNEWELKGVPVRLELGPNDIAKEKIVAARRDMRDEKGRLVKAELSWKSLEEEVQRLLEDIHHNLYAKAKKALDDNTVKVTKWDDFLAALSDGKLVLAPHCNTIEWEKKIAELSGIHFASIPDKTGAGQVGKAKALCIPLEQPELPEGTKCVISGELAKCWILFGRSY